MSSKTESELTGSGFPLSWILGLLPVELFQRLNKQISK